ncbi:Heterogeneous nuclear ribonucleoprotein K [Orchesella cincta]|uniref:Heterogeneous nuclear ribonucleoprotein K n=1 Tax=Orchesella cincta TaxID=48709 RepID=A0A1D2MCD4_ORCCI|nr:Heterogeneous nuclear ribonucleoprotein K [Orchesella cincta]
MFSHSVIVLPLLIKGGGVMKRGADRDMASPHKRARNLGQEIRILIPSRVAGSVIGKGGSNISRLRSEVSKKTVPLWMFAGEPSHMQQIMLF